MQTIATCDFRHKNVDYKKGEAVELNKYQLAALSHAGLVVDGKATESKTAESTEKKENIENTESGEDTVSTEEQPQHEQDNQNGEATTESPENIKPERKGAKKQEG